MPQIFVGIRGHDRTRARFVSASTKSRIACMRKVNKGVSLARIETKKNVPWSHAHVAIHQFDTCNVVGLSFEGIDACTKKRDQFRRLTLASLFLIQSWIPAEIKGRQGPLWHNLDHAHSAISDCAFTIVIAINSVFDDLSWREIVAHVSPKRSAHWVVSVSRSHCSLSKMEVPDRWPGGLCTSSWSRKNLCG
jgi:hypothetical protein